MMLPLGHGQPSVSIYKLHLESVCVCVCVCVCVRVCVRACMCVLAVL